MDRKILLGQKKRLQEVDVMDSGLDSIASGRGGLVEKGIHARLQHIRETERVVKVLGTRC